MLGAEHWGEKRVAVPATRAAVVEPPAVVPGGPLGGASEAAPRVGAAGDKKNDTRMNARQQIA